MKSPPTAARPGLDREPFTDARLGNDLLWRDVRVQRFSEPVPALFLDRDGVVIDETEYISRPEDVVLLAGIPDLIRVARSRGMAVVEITNQAGIGRGYFGWPEFIRVESRVAEVLSEHGVSVDAVFACPFHPEGKNPFCEQDHPWRKPNPGMLLEAAAQLNLDLTRSVLIGDHATDQNAARAAGLAFGMHVLTGHGPRHEQESRRVSSPDFPVYVVESATDAVALLASAG